VVHQTPAPVTYAADPTTTTVVSNAERPGLTTAVVTNPDQAVVAYPPPPFNLVHSPYTNRLVSPPRVEGKHTCGACGKFRSPAYHRRHPVAPGQVPAPGLCRNCRSIGTDSEDSDMDSDSAERRRRHRRRYRRRGLSIRSFLDSDDDRYLRRSSEVEVIRCPRSLSRVQIIRSRRSPSLDSFNYAYDRYSRRRYRSSSLDARPTRVSLPRRDRSLSVSPPRVVQRVRYVERSPPSVVSYAPRRRGSCRYSSYHADADDWEDVEDDR
jgi:hypothetical protein